MLHENVSQIQEDVKTWSGSNIYEDSIYSISSYYWINSLIWF